MRTKPSEEQLCRCVNGIVAGFVGRYGGDREEWHSVAWFAAGKALDTYREGVGEPIGWVGYVVRCELLEHVRQLTNRKNLYGLLDRSKDPDKVRAAEGWDAWCRRLAGELGGDAAAVVLAALDAPGEVAELLMRAGWSGPRVVAAMDQVREAVR